MNLLDTYKNYNDKELISSILNKGNEGFNNPIKIVSVMDSSHPCTVIRVAELLSWEKLGSFNSHLKNYK